MKNNNAFWLVLFLACMAGLFALICCVDSYFEPPECCKVGQRVVLSRRDINGLRTQTADIFDDLSDAKAAQEALYADRSEEYDRLTDWHHTFVCDSILRVISPLTGDGPKDRQFVKVRVIDDSDKQYGREGWVAYDDIVTLP